MQLTCKSHMKNFNYICLSQTCSEKRIACFECLQYGNHIGHLQEVKEIQDFFQLYQQEAHQNNTQLHKIGIQIDTIMKTFQILIDGVQLKYLVTESQYQQMNSEQINDLAQSIFEWRKDIDFIENTILGSINQLLGSINHCINTLQLKQNSLKLQNIPQQQKPFKYELIHSINDDDIYAFAFDNTSSLMVAGYSSQKIKVFEFREEKLNCLQELHNHNSFVYCLSFMKRSQSFLSGGGDKQIYLWTLNENNNWICKQKLQGHNDNINCLIISENEELIISGSSDQTIRFWEKDAQSSWKCLQILPVHKNPVHCISLNDSQKQLISCAQGENVIIISQQFLHSQNWEVIQSIQVDLWGYRLCFINNYMFTFQPKSKEQMYIYEIDESNLQFKKTKQVSVKGGHCSMYFPQQYIKSKSILLNKNGQHVNIMRKMENQEFVTEQSIQFGTEYIYGMMFQDGDYLITYDDSTRQIQVRKHQND